MNKPQVLLFTSELEPPGKSPSPEHIRMLRSFAFDVGAVLMVAYNYPPEHSAVKPVRALLYQDLNTKELLNDRRVRAAQLMAATGIIIDERLPSWRKRQIIEYALPRRVPLLALAVHSSGLTPPGTAQHDTGTIPIVHLGDNPANTEAALAGFIASNPMLVPVLTETEVEG